MREKLKEYVHLLFAGTVGKEDMEQEILQNTLDRFDDWVSRGFSEEDAYRKAVSGIGDIDALLGKAASPEREEASGYVPLGKRICNSAFRRESESPHRRQPSPADSTVQFRSEK